MEKFTQTLLTTRHKEFTRFTRLILNGQSLSVVSPSGGGKSHLLSIALPAFIKKHSSHPFTFHSLSPLRSDFADRVFDLQLSSDSLHVLLLDDLNRHTCTPSLELVWNYLWTQRTALKHRLVLIFAADETLDPSVFYKLGICYLENSFQLQPPVFKEMSVFMDCQSLDYSFTLTQKRRLFQLSGGNFRLAKNLIKELSSGISLDDLLIHPDLSPRISYFFTNLLQTGTAPGQLLSSYPDFSAYFSHQSPQGFELLLTSSEKKAFDLLLSQKGELVDRDDLIKYVWGDSKYLDLYDHSLDQLIYRLKQKIKSSPHRLHTRKGRGFILS